MNLSVCSTLPWGPLSGVWYRAIDPSHIPTALQTAQSLNHHSRFSAGPKAARPFELLQAAENPLVAQLEVYALVGNVFLPHTLTAPGRQNCLTFHVQVSLQRVVNLADPSVQSQLQTTEQELTGTWESYGFRSPGTPQRGLAPTQELGQALYDVPGLEGFITVSAKAPLYRTLVVFPQKLLVSSWILTTIAGHVQRIDGSLPVP